MKPINYTVVHYKQPNGIVRVEVMYDDEFVDPKRNYFRRLFKIK